MLQSGKADSLWALPGAAIAAALVLVPPAAGSSNELAALAETGRELCQAADLDHGAMAHLLDMRAEEERLHGPAGAAVRTVRSFADGERTLRLILDRPRGILHRVMLERHLRGDGGQTRPEGVVLLDGACELGHARRIRYDEAGLALEIALYDGDLAETGPAEPLNPPMPERAGGDGTDGVVVALFDSGLAYTLPEIAERLAHDAQGRALGYDFWDMNDRPFDADTSRSVFFPARHGTPVASVLLREAPDVRVVPLRYPRPDMDRMSDMVAAAAEAGVRIVQMPMGSNDPADWTAFERAARDHPEMLFVLSAGNNDRDLDEVPLWPAALGLENAVVVTSSEDDGRLARGSNWGPHTVDLMVPAENVPAVDYRGQPQRGSGTSFAVARLAALAARLLVDDPELSVAELKAALFARAAPVEGVRYGVILDPAL